MPSVRTQLANLYFDAENYAEATRWYEASLKIAPTNADVSTDLAVSYYYTNQVDQALAQFARSLEIDPKHTKTWLNLGIVRAFGKQDLAGRGRGMDAGRERWPPPTRPRRARRGRPSTA